MHFGMPAMLNIAAHHLCRVACYQRVKQGMLAIRVIVHKILGAQYSIPFPWTHLARFYQAFGIDLQLTEGEALQDDPKTKFAYETIARQYDGSLGSPAHLLVGLRLAEDIYTNGQLLTTRNRSCAAVFTESVHMRDAQDRPGKLLEVCAHEISHLLNRTHEDGDTTLPTIECAAGAFTLKDEASKQAAWNVLKPGGYAPPTTFPFSAVSEFVFSQATATSASILPWGDHFRGAGSIDETASRSKGMVIHLRKEKFEYKTGSPFACTVTIQNRGMKRIRCTSELHPSAGELTFEIVRPDKTKYIHRPRTYSCGNKKILILSGNHISQPLILLDGPGAQIFPEPGTYRIRAWMVRFKIASGWVTINVQKGRRPQIDKAFAKFLVAGPRCSRSRHWRKVNALLQTRTDDPLIPYLALIKARHLKSPIEKAQLLKIAGCTSSPRAIRHLATQDAALASTEHHSTHRLRSCCSELLKALHGRRVDRRLHERLEGVSPC